MPVRPVSVRLAAAACAALLASSPSFAAPPTAEEQFTLELINRARLDPRREVYRYRAVPWGDDPARVPGTQFPQPQAPDLNEGLPAGTISDAPKTPLAFNANLIQGARDYSVTLLNNNAFTHTYGGTTTQTRTQAAGYVYAGAWSWGENLAATGSTGAHNVNQANAEAHHRNLFVDNNVTGRGHRPNVMNANWKEIGIGFAQKAGYTGFGGQPFNAIISTYNFAYSGASNGGNPFVTGVVFDDTTDNNFYDVGEGVTPTVTVRRSSDQALIYTGPGFASGGYTAPVPANGVYDVTLTTAGGLNLTHKNVAVAAANVKLDAATDTGAWATAAGGNWSTAANWSGIQPNGAHHALFAAAITAPATVALDAPQRAAGAVTFRSAHAYTITPAAAGAKLVLSQAVNNARIDALQGSHTIATAVQFTSPLDVTVLAAPDVLTLSGPITATNTRPLNKFGKGALALSGDNAAMAGGVAVIEGPVVVGHSNALGTAAATVGWEGNAAALYAGASGVVVTTPITIAPGAGQRELGASANVTTATFAGPVTLRHDLRLNAAAGSSLSVTGGIGQTGGAHGVQVVGPGAVTLAGVNLYQGPTTVSGGGTLTLAGVHTATAGVTVTAGKVALAADVDLQAVDVQNSLPGDQSFDLAGKSLRVFAPDLPAAEAALLAQVALTGVDGVHDSTAPANAGVGYAIVNNAHLLAKKALFGDATLDGAVDFNDLVALAQNYNVADGARRWNTGDFTYDGNVDFNDLVKLAQNYNTSLSPAAPIPGAPADFATDLAAALATVPEPTTTLAALIACGIASAGRRRR